MNTEGELPLSLSPASGRVPWLFQEVWSLGFFRLSSCVPASGWRGSALRLLVLLVVGSVLARSVPAASASRWGGGLCSLRSVGGVSRRPRVWVERRGPRRGWAVWEGDELVVVAMYKKGALAVAARLVGR